MTGRLPLMTNIKKRRYRALFIVLSLLIFLWACSEELTEEDRLRLVVDEIAASARAKDVKAMMEHVSRDYNDDKGFDYDGVKGVLFYEFFRTKKVGVFVRGVDVEVKGDSALVNTKVLLVRGKAVEKLEDVIPEEANGFRFSVVFRKEEGEWKALSANWDRVGVLGLL